MIFLLYYLRYLHTALLPLLSVILLNICLGIYICFLPQLTKSLFDRIFITLDMSFLFKIIMLKLVLVMLMVIVEFFDYMVGCYVKYKLSHEIRIRVNNLIMRYPFRYFKNTDTGYIVKRVTEDTDQIASAITSICIISSKVLFIVITYLLFKYLGVWISNIYMGVLLSHIAWTLVLRFPVSAYYNKIGVENSNLYTAFWEVLPGIKEIKLMQIENYAVRKVERIQRKLKRNQITSDFLSTFLWSISFWGPWVGFLLTFVIGLEKVKTSEFSVGMLIAVMSIYWIAINPISTIIYSFTTIQMGSSAAKRLYKAKSICEEKGKGAKTNDIWSIKFKDVTFSYDEEREILKNVNIEFPEMKKIAIVGQTGSGKSTIAQLIVKLFHEYKGEISINDVNLIDYSTNTLRNKIAFMSQDVFIFSDTIKNNMKLDLDISDKDINDIIEKVNLKETIKKLPDGINSKIGDGGIDLSGGEKQRIQIARCLLKKSELIILDEATSALDPNNEKEILNTIDNAFKNKTIISITHRPSNAINCDYIVVVKDGEIVETGNHKQLLENDNEYSRIFYS